MSYGCLKQPSRVTDRLTDPQTDRHDEMVRFSPKNVELTYMYMFGQRYQQVGNRAMNKYYMSQ